MNTSPSTSEAGIATAVADEPVQPAMLAVQMAPVAEADEQPEVPVAAAEEAAAGEGWLLDAVEAQPQPTGDGAPARDAGEEIDEEELRRVREALAELELAQRRLECSYVLDARLLDSDLPLPVQQKLRARFEGAAFEAEVLEAAIAAEVESLAALRDAGIISDWARSKSRSNADERGPEPPMDADAPRSGQAEDRGAWAFSGDSPGDQRSHLEVGFDGAARGVKMVQAAWDRLFGVREALAGPSTIDGRTIPQWHSLLEAYVQTTGDPLVTGQVRPEQSIVREANEVTSTVLNEVVLNSMTKRLVQDYAGQPQEWRRFCLVSSLPDYKRQDRVALNDFSALSAVAEGGAYTNLAWGDNRESYTPSKRGNLVVITRETILNDDIDAVRKIPSKLAIAAGITINEFVYTTLIAGNPTMADGSKVYDDGVQTSHGNRGTAALSSSALTAAITSMLKQTNSAGKRIGQRPRFLLVPPDLWAAASVLVGSTLVPGSANNDVNVLRGALEPVIAPQFTDATDYYLFTDPDVMPNMEIGFVLGQEAPELLLQDSPVEGTVFTNDQLAYKIRWEFGGGWLDYRGTFKGDVAG